MKYAAWIVAAAIVTLALLFAFLFGSVELQRKVLAGSILGGMGGAIIAGVEVIREWRRRKDLKRKYRVWLTFSEVEQQKRLATMGSTGRAQLEDAQRLFGTGEELETRR